jgi:HSP20 family molecular chaperone IbpA
MGTILFEDAFMPTPKPALRSKVTPKTPQLVWGSDKEALEQAIRRRIAERAYFLFEASGGGQGNDQAHWLQAESEVLQRGLDVRESGSWLAITASLPDVLAEDVQIYLEPNRVILRATKSDEVKNMDSQTQGLTLQEPFVVEDLKVEVEPTTASASFKDQTLTLMVKKRYPTNAAAQ